MKRCNGGISGAAEATHAQLQRAACAVLALLSSHKLLVFFDFFFFSRFGFASTLRLPHRVSPAAAWSTHQHPVLHHRPLLLLSQFNDLSSSLLFFQQ
jgi:hypothetical protein